MPLHKNQEILLSIDAISGDGNGVGRHEGQVVFVPGAAVGDSLRVRIAKLAKSHAFGILRQMDTPGPGRIREDCPISGRCGGCAFRHLTYEAELAAKQSFVEDALRRIGGLEAPVAAILPSPKVDRYRNKVQYPVAAGQDGTLVYGFYASRSHRVIPCADCLLQPAEMNAMAAEAARLLREAGARPYNEEDGSGDIRHILLRQGTHSGQVLVGFVATRLNVPRVEQAATALAEAFPAIKTVVLNLNPGRTNVILGGETRPLLGDGFIDDNMAGVPVRLDIHTFSQVNTAAAEQLFAQVQKLAAPKPGDTLLDLYCGGGVIGLSMAAHCGRLLGVDSVPEAIEAARASAAQMGLANTIFTCEDAGQAAQSLAGSGQSIDIAVVDPPRKGMDEAGITALLEIKPKRLVMVSCNPATLARDLAKLVAGGYAVKQVQPADLFPRTRHVECAVLLERA